MTSRCAVKDKIMAGELTAPKKRGLDITVSSMAVPAIIAGAGGEAGKRFLGSLLRRSGMRTRAKPICVL